MRRSARISSVAAAVVLTAGLVAPTAAVAAPEDYDIDSATSLQVVVNKHRKLNPENHVPEKLTRVQSERLHAVAAESYERMVRSAKAEGVNIVPVSGCRSHARQASL